MSDALSPFAIPAAVLAHVALWGLGRVLVRLWRWNEPSRMAEYVVGFAAYVGIAHLLGLLGVLRPPLVLGIFAVGLVGAASAIRGAPLRLRFVPRVGRSWLHPLLLVVWAALLCAAAGLAPTGYDVRYYHLHLPSWYLAEGGFPYRPDIMFSVCAAQGFHLALTLPMALEGWRSCGVFYALFGVLFVAFAVAETHGEARRRTLLYAVLASPLLVFGYRNIGTDLPAALFAIVALHGFLAGSRDGPRDWSREQRALTACAATLALLCKQTAILPVALVGLGWWLRDGRRALPWLLGIAGFGLFWQWRNWLLTGNPVYPYFGPSNLDAYFVDWVAGLPGSTLLALQQLSLDVGSLEWGLHPLLLAAAGCALLVPGRGRALGIAGFVLLAALLALGHKVHPRYALPLLGALMVAGAPLLLRAAGNRGRRLFPAVATLCAFAVLCQAGLLIPDAARFAKGMTGRTVAEANGADRQAARWLADKDPEQVLLCVQGRMYYPPRAHQLGANIDYFRLHEASGPAQLEHRLRELGVRFVAVDHGWGETLAQGRNPDKHLRIFRNFEALRESGTVDVALRRDRVAIYRLREEERG